MSRRVAFVTGARGVVGQALITRLRRDGYRVIAHSRDGFPNVSEGVQLLSGDLADPGTVLGIAEEVLHLDLLVNNAASQATGSLEDLSAADWTDMLGSTLLSAVHLTGALRPAMPSGACVVNISSVEAGAPFPHHAHYAAAKAALESFTRSAALEWAEKGIRVNAVAPGLIARPGISEDWPAGVEWWERTCPLGRMIRADEVADAVALLASATGVSGVVLPVDGGWSASARLG